MKFLVQLALVVVTAAVLGWGATPGQAAGASLSEAPVAEAPDTQTMTTDEIVAKLRESAPTCEAIYVVEEVDGQSRRTKIEDYVAQGKSFQVAKAQSGKRCVDQVGDCYSSLNCVGLRVGDDCSVSGEARFCNARQCDGNQCCCGCSGN